MGFQQTLPLAIAVESAAPLFFAVLFCRQPTSMPKLALQVSNNGACGPHEERSWNNQANALAGTESGGVAQNMLRAIVP